MGRSNFLDPPDSQPQVVAQDNTNPAGVYTIKPGPDYDKWDEALRQYGVIRLPKELDNPQQWLTQPHIQQFLDSSGVSRRDLPDGSVILSRQVPIS